MTVVLWDAATGQPLGAPREFVDPLGWISEATGGVMGWFRGVYRDPLDDWFSPDRSTLLVDDNPKSARLRNIATGQAVGAPIPHQEPIVCAAFSRDGTRIAIGAQDRTARVYDARTGAPAARPMAHAGWVTDVAFSPDGRTILTASRDGTARLWNAATGEPIGSPLRARRRNPPCGDQPRRQDGSDRGLRRQRPALGCSYWQANRQAAGTRCHHPGHRLQPRRQDGPDRQPGSHRPALGRRHGRAQKRSVAA